VPLEIQEFFFLQQCSLCSRFKETKKDQTLQQFTEYFKVFNASVYFTHS